MKKTGNPIFLTKNFHKLIRTFNVVKGRKKDTTSVKV